MDNPLTGWWFGTSSMFPYIGNFIIPTDVHSFFSEGFKPPTRYTDMKIIIIHNFSGLHYFRILKSPLFMDNPSTNACFFLKIWILFPYIYIYCGNFIIPTDFYMFQDGHIAPPTTDRLTELAPPKLSKGHALKAPPNVSGTQLTGFIGRSINWRIYNQP